MASAQQQTAYKQGIETHKSFSNSMVIQSMLFSLTSSVGNFEISKNDPVFEVGGKSDVSVDGS